jgi:thiamine transporter ThiT
MKRKNFILSILLLFCICLGQTSAQESELSPAELASRGNYLTIKIALLGPGDDIYLWWGHIALIIEDSLSGENRFYDWGVFDFEQDNFYVNFALGRLLYRCAVTPEDASLSWNVLANRGITIYTLDLPPEAKAQVFLFAENNVLPENRNYWYHHFKDNCATRIRDIIDTATGGAFKERYGDAPGRFTLRQHVRRHTWFSPFWDWALSFWMGQDIDRPISVWDEMFLPSEIASRIEDFSYTDSRGIERKLVSSSEIFYTAVGKPGVLEQPGREWWRELFAGIILALLFIIFHFMEKKPGPARAARILSGLSQSLLGLFFGATGLLLFFLTFFTNHDYTYHNTNVIFVNPLLFAAIPLGLSFAFRRDPKKRDNAAFLLKILWTYVFLGGILTIALKFFSGFYQQNQATQALVLPFAFVLSFFMFRKKTKL